MSLNKGLMLCGVAEVFAHTSTLRTPRCTKSATISPSIPLGLPHREKVSIGVMPRQTRLIISRRARGGEFRGCMPLNMIAASGVLEHQVASHCRRLMLLFLARSIVSRGGAGDRTYTIVRPQWVVTVSTFICIEGIPGAAPVCLRGASELPRLAFPFLLHAVVLVSLPCKN